MLLHDIIMTSYGCQQYTECLVTTLYSSRTVHWHTVPRTRNSQETPDFLVPNLWPSNSSDLNPVDYKTWAVMQHRVYHRSLDELKRRLIDVSCSLEKSIFDEAIGQ